ncbi:hypothetical protein WCV66_13670 [Metabacillus sp. FJAT-53654]|uniref:Uncharacterized protein n=1 Tax=Metabacillus rhizosphaerae TaxID=3117747 RepID=A0ABZ2N0L5_9BACI|nr:MULTISPECIES: hypothetical protein [Metabacillus]
MYKNILYLFFIVIVLTIFIFTNFKESFYAFL